MTKTAAAQDITVTGFALVSLIAAQEDAKRYRGPVTFFNDQLKPLLGIGKWETLDEARSKAVASGWLHYFPPPTGSRSPGKYWSDIPPSLVDLPDSTTDENEPEHIRKTDTVEPEHIRKTDTVGDTVGGNLPSYSLFPISCPGSSPDEPTGQTKKPKPAIREPSPEDLDVASWMWARVQELQPTRKPPDLQKWSDTVRLMRERDGRSHEQIRDLFQRVQSDQFWRLNILSPDKLRSKWDDLSLRLGGARAPMPAKRSPSPYKKLD